MKKLITILAIVLCATCNIYSQLALETTYFATDSSNVKFNYLMGKIKINQTTTKYLTANYYLYQSVGCTYNVTYKLYNLNHSLYKTLPFISDSLWQVNQENAFPFSIQENLFNTNTDIEIAYIRYKSGIHSFKVINEYGNVLFERDSVINWSQNNGYGLSSTQEDGFYNTENGAKLILLTGPYLSRTKEVYSLGGSIITGLEINNGGNEEGMIALTPNPSKEYTRITYSLPSNEISAEIVIYNISGSEIKRFTVDRTFNDLIVSNDDLPAGNYFYSLFANNQLISTKKSIVIK